MKKKILLCLLIVLITLPLFASDNEENKEYQQYEYMVVSFGKAWFSSFGKAAMYFDDGLNESACGALFFEMNLDVLGADGWELVGIVGVIGGEQQFVLKRPL